MRPWPAGVVLSISLAASLVALLVPGCSSGAGGGGDGDGGDVRVADTGPTGQPDEGARSAEPPEREDAATDPVPASCGAVLRCTQSCSDEACMGRCLDLGSPADRALFDELRACSRRECPTADQDCRCEAECLSTGACTEIRDRCVENGNDPFCELCH